MTDKTLEDLTAFYNNPNNWRPPSLSQVAKFMGVKSKATARKYVKKLNDKK